MQGIIADDGSGCGSNLYHTGNRLLTTRVSNGCCFTAIYYYTIHDGKWLSSTGIKCCRNKVIPFT